MKKKHQKEEKGKVVDTVRGTKLNTAQANYSSSKDDLENSFWKDIYCILGGRWFGVG